MQKEQDLIRKQAIALGYDLVAFTPLSLSKKDKANLLAFAKGGFAGSMDWYERHLRLRLCPSELFPEAQGAIVLAVFYRDVRSEEALQNARLRISRYAHGKDYHRVLRKKAKRLLQLAQREIPHIKGRITVDSAPLPEKILARMAGLGWQGKNTNIIHPQWGSWFFLSTILVNLCFEASQEMEDMCRSCHLCIDACPTQALFREAPYGIDARRCLSYLNIEHKEEDSREEAGHDFAKWAFGCDICQEVCPYNRKKSSRKKHTKEEAFFLRADIAALMRDGKLPYVMENEESSKADANTKEGEESLSLQWQEWSKGTPLRRISERKMKRNMAQALGRSLS